MRFTDEDLKQFLSIHGEQLFYMALIARLEAAERLCNQAEHYRWSGMSQLLDEWRKAAGK